MRSLGCFPKTHIRDIQLKQQTVEPDIRTKEALDNFVSETSQKKLREAKKDESSEMEQLRLQQYKEIEDRMIISAPPLDEFPSGMLAIQIHEATGLEVRALHNADRYNNGSEHSDEEEQSEELPSCYCNIIINHQKVYRTRVKPKNQKPFYNAGTERFIRDWRNTIIHISLRDSRVHEDDALMGMVRLSLGDILKDRSQVNNTYPLYGGVGYGRVRISLVFRSVNLQVSSNLIGWDYGTLVIKPNITAKNLPSDLQSMRLKLQTSISTGHMYNRDNKGSTDHQWSTSHDKKLHLAVRKRYSSPLVIQFRKDRHFLDKTAAFAVLWLTDLADDKEATVTLSVWKGDLKRATTCYLSDCGEKVGEIELTLTFCKGLDKAHNKLAGKDENLRDVMEVVDSSRYQTHKDEAEADGALASPSQKHISPQVDGEDEHSDSADSSSDDNDSDGGEEGLSSHDGKRDKENSENTELQDSGHRDLTSSWKDYKSHAKQMHRRHRGVMQHKSARTMWWMKHKVENVSDRVSGVFSHHERTGGVETEA